MDSLGSHLNHFFSGQQGHGPCRCETCVNCALEALLLTRLLATNSLTC